MPKSEFISSKNFYLPIAIAVAVAIRIAYWIAVGSEPWFQTPGMDPEFYFNWASAIISGHGSDYLPFPRAPLYPYILAGLRAIFGDGWIIPRLFNLLCDVLTIVSVWTIAKHVANHRAGLFAALFVAMSGMSVYMSGELLMTSIETMLAAAYLLFFIRTIETKQLRSAALTGLFAALFSLCRPNGLLLVFAAPVILILLSRKTIIAAVFLLTSALVCLAPATYFNYAATGKIIPVATQGGVNFFIGNARGATGWSSTLPGISADWTDADAASLANSNARRTLSEYEQSQQLWEMGWAEIRADVPGWCYLMLRKTLLLLNIREIGNNRPLTLPFESAPYLRLLFFISIGAMLPFALAGIQIASKNRHFIYAALSFIFLFGGSLLLFFISSRYRMPLLPVVAVLAGIGANSLIENWKNFKYKVILLPLVAGIAIAYPPWSGSRFDNPAQGYFVVGNALLKQGKPDEARQFYARTFAIEPGYPRLHLNFGAAFLAGGDTLRAVQEFEKELLLFPDRGEALNNLAVIAERRGEIHRARELYRSATEKIAGASDAGENLLRLTLQVGDGYFQIGNLDSAEFIYQSMANLFVEDHRPLYRLALVRATRGDYSGARNLLQNTVTLKPDFQPARDLLKELPK